MKSPLCFLLFAMLALASTTAFAQRESFDATVIRKADAIILSMESKPGAKGVERPGFDSAGNRATFFASVDSVSFANIYFKLDSTELRDHASELQVDEIATALKSPKHKETKFLIEGHTCDLGADDYNLLLSARRAEAIRKLLAKKGVNPDRIAVLGFGETELVDPVKAKDSPAQAETRRMKSRRVVLRRLLPDKAPAKK